MPINGSALLKAFIILAKKESMRTSVLSSLGSGVVVSASVGVGLLFGPFGPAVGCAIGSAGTYLLTRNKYKSVIDILQNELTKEDKDQLIRLLEDAFRDITVQDVMNYGQLLLMPHSRNQLIKDHVFKVIIRFLTEYNSQPRERECSREESGRSCEAYS